VHSANHGKYKSARPLLERHLVKAIRIALLVLASSSLMASAQAPAGGFSIGPSPAGSLPEGPNREVTQRVCSGCHSVQIFAGRGMTREQWAGVVSSMIGRGAKMSDEEYDQIVAYLARALPPAGGTATAQATAKKAPAPRSGGLIDQVGPDDKQVVDADAAARGKTLYIAQCITCHGTNARGGERGPDLVRSVLVLHDRYGSTLAPYLAKGHPAGNPVSLQADQVVDLSHYLHQQVGDTLRTGPYNKVLNILVGDPGKGKLYFEGKGGCTQCHSATGDLAHIASKYDPANLQLKTVFPMDRAIAKNGPSTPRKPLTVTVTDAKGESVTGIPVELDDFNVALRDSNGQYHTFARGPGVKVEKHDPYAAHIALLDRYTDQEIHDVVAYLETLR
jgi:mono/diheme cytochrome c family protein